MPPVINWELDAMLTDAWKPDPGHSNGQQRLRTPARCSVLVELTHWWDSQAKDAAESDRGAKAGFLTQLGLSG